MKNGFTLMELLVVIVIVAVISVSSVLVFGNIDDSTALTDRKNLYKDIQRTALLYIDLDDKSLYQFRESGQMHVTIAELQEDDYLEELKDPVTGDIIPPNYLIKIYTANRDGYDYIDTCILNNSEYNSAVYCDDEMPLCTQAEIDDCLADPNNPDKCNCYSTEICDFKACIANSDGKPTNCCMN